jgi:hypothetical protein
MGRFNLTESERRDILNLHNKAKMINEAPPAMPDAGTPVAAPAAAATTDRKALITQIQQILKTKYKSDLGTTGAAKDGIDGNLGPKTLAAINAVMANKPKTGAEDNDVEDFDDNQQTPAAPAATTQTPAAPAATTQTPAAPVQTALNQMTQQGQNLQNKLNQTVTQLSQLTPQQKANAEALKAGKPLPQQPVNPNDI